MITLSLSFHFPWTKLRAKALDILLQVCMTQSLYWLPWTSCFFLLLQNQVFKGCWKNLTPIDPAITLHFFMVCYFYCAWHCESRGQGPIKTGYQKLEKSEFIPPSPLDAVTALASHCSLFKLNLDPATQKKKETLLPSLFPTDEKESPALYLQWHKSNIHYKDCFAKHRP